MQKCSDSAAGVGTVIHAAVADGGARNKGV